MGSLGAVFILVGACRRRVNTDPVAFEVCPDGGFDAGSQNSGGPEYCATVILNQAISKLG
jgi:hypothetical protein